MTHQKIVLSSLVTVSLMALGACTSDNTSVSAEQETVVAAKVDQKQSNYVKPGAAIQFSHNYDGKTQPGEVESFQVFVKGGSAGSTMDVKMDTKDALKIYNGAGNQKFSIEEGAGTQTMNVSVGAQDAGRYYLNFFATAKQGDGEPIMRAYSMAIQVGDQPYVPELGKGMTLQEMPTGEKIISMEAKEN